MLSLVYRNTAGRLRRAIPLLAGCAFAALASYDLTAFAAGPALVDITSQVEIKTSGFRVNHRNGTVAQAVIITNISNKPLYGVLHLAVNELSANVNVSSNDDGAVYVSQYGDSMLRLNKGAEVTLLPNEKFTTSLQFSNTGNKPVKYHLSLFKESGA